VALRNTTQDDITFKTTLEKALEENKNSKNSIPRVIIGPVINFDKLFYWCKKSGNIQVQ